MEENMEKEKNIVVYLYIMKENIYMEENMEKEKITIYMVDYPLKENIYMEENVEKEKNI